MQKQTKREKQFIKKMTGVKQRRRFWQINSSSFNLLNSFSSTKTATLYVLCISCQKFFLDPVSEVCFPLAQKHTDHVPVQIIGQNAIIVYHLMLKMFLCNAGRGKSFGSLKIPHDVLTSLTSFCLILKDKNKKTGLQT